jgi:hypothetical protein
MIKNYELVKELVEDTKAANEIIHNLLIKVMNNRPQDEFTSFRKSVGRVLWSIYKHIIAPITEDFPDLDPTNEKDKIEIKRREDDIPIYDKDAPPFLERLYHVRKTDGSMVGLSIHFSKPAKSKDADDWYCTFRVSSEFGSKRKKAFGVDSIQALQNAFIVSDGFIDSTVKDLELKWVGGDKVDLLIE